MSLLLDALRKSESRRRLGQAPGLELPAIPVSENRPRGPSFWLLTLVPLVLVAVAAAWWLWPADPDLSAPAMVAESADTPARQAPAEDVPEPVSGPARTLEPEVVREAPRRTDAAPADPGGESPVAQEPGIPEIVRVPPEQTEPEPAAAEQPPPAEPVVQVPEATPEVVPEPGAEESAAVEEPEPAAPTRVDPAQVAEYLRVWELPRNVRENLPPLSLSINVYSERPEARFALINGERRREGDEIAPGVTLHRITREGAVLDYRDYRFLLD